MSNSPQSIHILLADDSESERLSAAEILQNAGYQVTLAVDGVHALEQYGKTKPDLVVLDVVMPRMTGLEVCRLLKAKTKGTFLPVLLVSSRNSSHARVDGLRSGADDYIGKPYDAEELLARVETLLRTKNLFRHDDSEIINGAGLAPDVLQSRGEEEFTRAVRFGDALACLHIGWNNSGAAQHRELETVRRIAEEELRKVDVWSASPGVWQVLLPNTHISGALQVAERLIARVRSEASDPAPLGTLCIGVAFMPKQEIETLADLWSKAEQAYGRARELGEQHICLIQHHGYAYRPES